MNKNLNNFKKKFITLSITTVLSLSSLGLVFADGTRVVTLGANLTQSQKDTMLKYFGVNKDEVVILEVNNQEERKYLEGVATQAQLGNKTYSCSYVEPTKSGSGINVKTANITWVTPAMVATTLSTAGLTDADVVIAANFPVSGTGALTGIMKAFEDATGEPLDEDKKELASEELITTGDLGEDIGQDKATGIVNDVKTEIIKNNTKDTVQIAETINNVVNNYNVTLSNDQIAKLESLMSKISEQDYNYNEMKNALDSVSDVVDENLSAIGENINNDGFFDSIKDFFTGIGDWFKEVFSSENNDSSILNSTNDSLLGEDAQIDATDKSTINLPSSEEVEGFFAKIINWFKELFNNESDNNQDNTQQTEIVPSEENNTNNETSNLLDENSSTDETFEDNSDTSVSSEDDEILDVQTEDQGSFDTQEQESN